MQREHRAAHARFVEGRELCRANRSLCRSGESPRRLVLAAQQLECAKHALERLRALAHEPVLELLADAADVDALEQLAAIERDRLVVARGRERFTQRGDIAPQL